MFWICVLCIDWRGASVFVLPWLGKWQLLPFCSSVYICPYSYMSISFWGVNLFSKKLKVFRKNYCDYISTTCLLSTMNFENYCFVQTLFSAFLKFGVNFEDGLHCVFGTHRWKNATCITTWGKSVATKVIRFELLESSRYLWNIIYCTIYIHNIFIWIASP
jgi:hypothetical protein